MNNIQKFTTAADYSAATHSYPNVSWITSGDTLIYTAEEPTPPTNIPPLNGFDIAVTYNVTDASQEVQLTTTEYDANEIEEMEVDGVDETPSSTYRFSTTGQHVVRYKITSDTLYQTFKEVPNILYMNIGGNVSDIDNEALMHIQTTATLLEIQLQSEFNSSYIASTAFWGNTSLEKLIVLDTTPPTISGNFLDSIDNCNIYVPSSAVNTYKSASGWSTYADRIFAI